jgi:hypothetical protein
MTRPLASNAPIGAYEEVVQVATAREQAFQDGNLEALMEWLAEDAAVTAPASPFRIEGKEALKAYDADLFQAFPTRRIAVRQRTVRIYGTTAVIKHLLHRTPDRPERKGLHDARPTQRHSRQDGGSLACRRPTQLPCATAFSVDDAES